MNKKQLRDYRADYYSRNKDKIIAQHKEWAVNNPEAIRAYARNWKNKNISQGKCIVCSKRRNKYARLCDKCQDHYREIHRASALRSFHKLKKLNNESKL